MDNCVQHDYHVRTQVKNGNWLCLHCGDLVSREQYRRELLSYVEQDKCWRCRGTGWHETCNVREHLTIYSLNQATTIICTASSCFYCKGTGNYVSG